ncbi:methyl-accepting chemotaxis protein [Clostridium chromiireducens]|uniref:Methyl-accepting chemotaxis protein n=1 Tax=Clostridium chromiireducens TaxID=225345 RepID=A0A399IUB5_9CLOT|nr:methyl-accepting chemotaxis protein [Clostridium chromiireducens]RII36057.1 methyl-accepting chemotaxis protein [Clostridium chromiireducens]
MKWFNDLKIRTRLMLSFGIVALFIAVVGGLAVFNINKVSSNSNILYEEGVKELEALQQFNSNTLHTRIEILNLINNGDISKIEEAKSKISDFRKQNDEILKSYDRAVLNDNEKQIYNDIKKELTQYRSESDKIIKLVSEQNYDEATKLSNESAKTRENLTNSIDKLVEHVETNANEINTSNDNIKSKFIKYMFMDIFLGFAIAIILGVFVTTITTNRLKKVLEYAKFLENGDLTHKININSKDEIGILAKALDNANDNLRNLIGEIIKGANMINSSGEELSATTQEVSAKMEEINEATQQISNGAQDLSTATEEVSASAEEIGATTSEIANRANDAATSVNEIKKRSLQIKEKATENIGEGNRIYEEKKLNILKAIEDGRIVNKVKSMAEAIGDIASQTNLLALNAAIEAARAGENGKGFAVVADEVRNLAEESSQAVLSIQEMVLQVQSAFENLSQSGEDILNYIGQHVKPSYELLMNTGIQYEKDAEFVDNITKEFAYSSKQINEVIDQINNAIQSVSTTAAEAETGSEDVLNSIGKINEAVNDIAKSAHSQAELSERLNDMVQKFKL